MPLSGGVHFPIIISLVNELLNLILSSHQTPGPGPQMGQIPGPPPSARGPRFPFSAESGNGDSPFPDSGRIGKRGFPPRFRVPAKSGNGGTLTGNPGFGGLVPTGWVVRSAFGTCFGGLGGLHTSRCIHAVTVRSSLRRTLPSSIQVKAKSVHELRMAPPSRELCGCRGRDVRPTPESGLLAKQVSSTARARSAGGSTETLPSAGSKALCSPLPCGPPSRWAH
jgi:hypothetical protein